MEESRFIIGIDLGTTNSAVFFVDTAMGREIELFRVPQVIASGEVDDQDLLPSFCYLPGGSELPEGAIRLPWDNEIEHAVGVFARDQGAAVPSRLVASAKSWLAHAGVDRSKPILPWGSELGEQMHSPVDVTSRYLDHIRRAWNHKFRSAKDADGNPCILEEQQVVVTIPASFDETARELTINAARNAGFKKLVLLEEPLAAFYSWLHRNEDTWKEQLKPGERVLVIDVGGGTSDFSFIETDENGSLHRFAVGEHLLLGGDNIDIAVARSIEQGWDTKLPVTEWSMLVQLCRRAKEELLNSDLEETTVTLLSRGSSVIRSARTATLTRKLLMQLLDEGFYPKCKADAPPPRKAGGMREMGLPYAAEPAVTLHLLHFLRYAAGVAEQDGLLFPHKILFNGGSMIAPHVREQVLGVIASWFPEGESPAIIEGEDLSLAVAQGAAYYGRVRRGEGVRVRGGISRSYFVAAEDASSGEQQLVCVMSRDTDENVDVHVPGKFMLQTNSKVQFRLYSSATRLHDKPGDRLTLTDEISEVAPLVTVLQFGKDQSRDIEVGVLARLTEIGTLELLIEAEKTEHTWPLRFDLRPIIDDSAPQDVIIVDVARIEEARAQIKKAFTESPELLVSIVKDLEKILELKRDEWSLPLLRDLADTLLELEGCRKRSPRHEARWLNLTGFCMRPGFGEAADELRMRKIWKLWFPQVNHKRDAQVLADWWVFWRRVASGLRDGHQSQIGSTVAKTLYPKGNYRNAIKEGDQAKREMWRCLGSLELFSAKNKARAGRVLIERVNKLDAYEYWVLARLGVRHLFHGPAELVLPAAIAADWVKRILDAKVGAQSESMRQFAISLAAGPSGDRKRDLPDKLVRECIDFLEAQDAPVTWIDRLRGKAGDTRADQAKILGDSLPLGLRIVGE